MNTKIALSGISILASLALVGGATYAFFTDSATSTNNTFGASSMTIQLSNDGTNFSDDVTQTFNVPNMFPGLTKAQTITFRNSGSTPIAEIEMGLSATAVDNGSNGSDLRNVLGVRVFENSTADGGNTTCVGGSEVTGLIHPLVGDNIGLLTMTEFNGDTYDALNLPIPVSAADKNLCVIVTMDPDATDFYQGDSVNTSFTFTANQDTTQ